MLRTAVLLLFALLTLSLPAAAAPLNARSLSGSGLLLLRSSSGAGLSRLVLYREPGLGRIAELDAAQLPQIAPSFEAADGLRAVIVTAKKLGWYRIVYDAGEREGWLQGRSAQRFQRWEELLPGKSVALPAGLKKDFYLLRSEPDLAAEAVETIGKESGLVVLRVAGNWINVRRGAKASGWLRWRDDNGRLLIAVDYRAISKDN